MLSNAAATAGALYAVLAAAGLAQAQCGPATYVDVCEAVGTSARDIDDSGAVTGDANITSGWLWVGGVFTALPGAVMTASITDGGTVGGKSGLGPTLWPAGGGAAIHLHYLLPNDPPNSPFRYLFNSRVVDYRGSKAVTSGSEGSYVWTPGVTTEPVYLSTGGGAITPYGINTSNVVVGSRNTSNDGDLPCVWQPPSYDLQLLASSGTGRARVIDSGGVIYGETGGRACRWVGGSLEYLSAGTGTRAVDVASNGDVLIAGPNSSNNRGILSQGVFTSIPPLMPPGFTPDWQPLKLNAHRQVLAVRSGVSGSQAFFVINVPWRPDPPQPPSSSITCASGTATFSVAAAGTGPFSFQWRKGGSPIDTLANPSAATAALTLTNVQATDAGSYDCVISNACGSVTSAAATLTVSCPNKADVAQIGGGAGCDGQITVDDIVYYLNQFFGGNTAVADIVGLGGSGPPEGAVTVDDLVAFLNAFFAGCP